MKKGEVEMNADANACLNCLTLVNQTADNFTIGWILKSAEGEPNTDSMNMAIPVTLLTSLPRTLH